jgi:hypothetical protein
VVREDKSERFAIRMAPSEVAMLRELGEADGESDAAVVRRLIRRAHAERFGEGGASPLTRTSKKGGAESVRRWVAEARSKKR